MQDLIDELKNAAGMHYLHSSLESLERLERAERALQAAMGLNTAA